MSISTEALGGALPLQRSSLTEPQRALFDRLTQSSGPLGRTRRVCQPHGRRTLHWPVQPLLLSPAIAGRFLDFQSAEEEGQHVERPCPSGGDPRRGRGVAFRYELYAHSAAARTAGLLEEAVDTLAEGGVPDELSHAERCAGGSRLSSQPIAASIKLSTTRPEEAFGTRGLADMLF